MLLEKGVNGQAGAFVVASAQRKGTPDSPVDLRILLLSRGFSLQPHRKSANVRRLGPHSDETISHGFCSSLGFITRLRGVTNFLFSFLKKSVPVSAMLEKEGAPSPGSEPGNS